MLAVEGVVDLAAVAVMRRDAERALAGAGGPIVLDLSGVTTTDVATLRVMLQASERCTAAGRPLVLLQPSSQVRELLRRGALESLVPVIDQDADAVAQMPLVAPTALAG